MHGVPNKGYYLLRRVFFKDTEEGESQGSIEHTLASHTFNYNYISCQSTILS